MEAGYGCLKMFGTTMIEMITLLSYRLGHYHLEDGELVWDQQADKTQFEGMWFRLDVAAKGVELATEQTKSFLRNFLEVLEGFDPDSD